MIQFFRSSLWTKIVTFGLYKWFINSMLMFKDFQLYSMKLAQIFTSPQNVYKFQFLQTFLLAENQFFEPSTPFRRSVPNIPANIARQLDSTSLSPSPLPVTHFVHDLMCLCLLIGWVVHIPWGQIPTERCDVPVRSWLYHCTNWQCISKQGKKLLTWVFFFFFFWWGAFTSSVYTYVPSMTNVYTCTIWKAQNWVYFENEHVWGSKVPVFKKKGCLTLHMKSWLEVYIQKNSVWGIKMGGKSNSSLWVFSFLFFLFSRANPLLGHILKPLVMHVYTLILKWPLGLVFQYIIDWLKIDYKHSCQDELYLFLKDRYPSCWRIVTFPKFVHNFIIWEGKTPYIQEYFYNQSKYE